MKEKNKPLEKSASLSREKKNKLFYYLLIAYPVIQFCIFYIGVNANSVLLAFKEYTITTAKGQFSGGAYNWVGFKKFAEVWSEFVTKKADGTASMLMIAFKNSLISYGISMVVGTPLHIFFAYYIYKKKFGSTFFRIVLFLPSVISPIVMAVMFQYFVNFGLPRYMLLLFNKECPALLSIANGNTTVFPTLMFYMIWVGFGTSILVYNGSMSGIDVSVTEAAKLDGATGLREFNRIVFPLIYPTFVTFFITGFAAVFTNQINLFSFYGDQGTARLWTLGYYLYCQTKQLTLTNITKLSAMGLFMTAITVPLTLILRRVLTKIGPSVD